MRHRRVTALVCLTVLLGLGASAAFGGPRDARPGEIRAVYKSDGTGLRPEPKGLAKPACMLPAKDRIRVLEVRLPWLRVSSVKNASQQGWLRATETTDLASLNPNPKPQGAPRGATGGVTQRDVAAAGRQLGPSTEQGYRASRPDLQRAYQLVDQMEQETVRLEPTESVAFIVGGVLGRQGQDYARPPLIPWQQARPRVAAGGGGRANAGRVVGGVLGGLAGRLGGGRAGDIAKQAVTEAGGFLAQVQKSFTPSQEYYLGRAVAATAIAKYGVDGDPERRKYVRQVGDAIVRLSTRLPATYGGYHFEVLDSDAVNGVSGPGGFVLITRGAVNACKTEDELAGVLAHELGHVKLKHGEATLRKGKTWQSAVGGLARIGKSATPIGDNALAGELVNFFSEVVGDVARTSMEHDYGRAAEFAADLEGTYLLTDVVYDHWGLRNLIASIATVPGAYGRAATHAPAQSRVAYLDPTLQKYGAFRDGGGVLDARKARFDERAKR